ncbi:MAG TPA: hypothetical protein VKC56_08000 [Gallionellaceae bacterium]|nr:hypothetical protein [Gallionellaceae bacterium]
MASYTEEDILAGLDEAQQGECWEWPDFGHLDYDTLTAPMVVLRDENRWAIVFCAVEWDADNALTATIMPVGNCVRIPTPEHYRRQLEDYIAQTLEDAECPPEELWEGFGMDGEYSERAFEKEMEQAFLSELGYQTRRLDSVKLEYDFDNESLEHRGYVRAVRVRGKQVDFAKLTIEPDDSRDAAFAIGLAAVRKYRDQMLANAAEAARFFPDGMPPVFMVIDQWHYSKWVRPSKTEVFQQLARALAENDPACYAPTREPNTEWQIGTEPDWEEDLEEDGEETAAFHMPDEDEAVLKASIAPPKEDEARVMDDIIAAMKALALNTAPMDREACVAAFSELYAAERHALPEFVFCSSPRDFQERASGMLKKGQRFEEVAGGRLVLGWGAGENPDPRDGKRIQGVLNYVNDRLGPYPELAACIKVAEAACIPNAMHFHAPRSIATAGLLESSIQWQALEALGLQEGLGNVLLRIRGASACGGYDTYARYCFVIDRPSRIQHPELTVGVPAGRCRVEWRDGYAYELGLN